MKFSASALTALSLLCTTTCSAFDLDPDSTDSIKQIAKTVSTGLRKYYTGDRPGDVPGNLPDPYFWWECGAMFGAFVDYWYYTGDSQYVDITKQAIIHQIGDNNAFMPPNQTKTLGNDDQAFWGMTAMSAAEAKFPDPPEGTPSWVSLAQGVFNTQADRWDDTKCGGGLKWQIFPFNKGFTYKNTISNGAFFNIAARLYKYTGNETYADWATRAFEWEQSVGLISKDWHFFDGSDENLNCTQVSHIQWTYNAGIHMAGSAAMFNMTGDQKWKARLDGIIKGIDVFFHKEAQVMFEVACERNGMCDVDQRSFKSYLCRWMGFTMQVVPTTKDTLMPMLRRSAVAAAKQCNAGEDGNQCGLRWWRGTNDGEFGVGEQMSAMEVMQNLLVDQVPGPASLKSGGTSKSDPNAGSGPQVQPKFMDEVTTGDKAGAGILTTIVLIGVLGGAWWMIS